MVHALNTSAPFKYRDAVIAALEAGGSCRADERELWANELLGTYMIRLRIALDPNLNGGVSEDKNWRAQDLRQLTASLGKVGVAQVRVFYVHAPDGGAYWVIQAAKEGEHLGCLRVEPQRTDVAG